VIYAERLLALTGKLKASLQIDEQPYTTRN
jgi:hypothetical protein